MAIQSAKRKAALKTLGIASDRKLILCLDGGGIRGILTIQLLKKLEEVAGIPCYELFDMVAGTSTGGIISALIVTKHTAAEIEELYVDLVTLVFKKRSPISDRVFNPPKWDKVNYRALLKEMIGNQTLEQACTEANLDLIITSKDIAAGEETFFSCFCDQAGCKGTYKDVLLRAVMEATMSAPTYFTPFERFLDGGTTTYNNPSLAAIMEAAYYAKADRYPLNKLTVFSFGTGISVQFVDPKQAADPDGIDAEFWLNYVMTESGQDASDLQTDTIRTLLMLPHGKVDYRRFQISFDPEAIKQLPDRDISDIDEVDANKLSTLTPEELVGIKMDDVTRFELVKRIGDAMAEYIMTSGNAFTKDLVNERKRDCLVTARGAVPVIQKHMSDPAWVKKQST